MHIVFFEFITVYGGAPRSVVEFAGRLARHSKVSLVDPYGFCAEFTEALRKTGVDHHVLDRDAKHVFIGGAGYPLKRICRLARTFPELLRIQRSAANRIRELGATVVCTGSKKSFTVLACAPTMPKVPIVAHMRGWGLPGEIPGYAMWLYKRRCAWTFAISEPSKAALRCAGIEGERITVLHNPIDPDDLLARAELPAVEPIPQMDRPIRLLLPALLLRTKGQHTAIEALRKVVDRGHDATLWLAGSVGVGGDQTYVERTKQLAKDLGVAERVEWLGLRSDIPRLMSAATMVLLPSHTEGLGRVLLEAMVLGKPVAATPAGGICDLILPGVTGQLFEIEDADGLADCITWVADHPEQAERMAQRAKDYVRTSPRFSPERHTERALEVFRKLSGGA